MLANGATTDIAAGMSGLKMGYARVSTNAQDLTARRTTLNALEVEPERCTSTTASPATNCARLGLREALVCRAGDILVVITFDRLAPFLPDACDHR